MTQKSLCIFKQYVQSESKPLHLHCSETVHQTLSSSLAFVVALAWNEFFKASFDKASTRGLDAKLRPKLLYAVMATAFLFGFNIVYTSILTKMRHRAQKHATDIHRKKKYAAKKPTDEPSTTV